MVNTRNTDSRLDGLEKAAGELEKGVDSLQVSVGNLNAQFQKTNERISAVASQLELFIAEMRKTNGRTTDEESAENLESGTAEKATTASLTMPSFDGSEAVGWLARAEQYFLVSNTPVENRVKVAMVALTGPALPWYQLLINRIPNLSWDRFLQELMKRFGNNGALDEYEAFAAVRHTGSLADYVAVFESRLALVPDLAYHQYLGFFLAGLRPDVRLQMKAAKVTNYSDAVQLALDIDQVPGNLPPYSGQSLTAS